MEFSISASALNTVATGAYYSHKMGCISSLKRRTKKAIMKNVKCVVLSDVYRNRLFNDLYTTDENLKLLNIEKLFEITFGSEALKALRRMRVEDYDIYLSLTVFGMRDLLEKYRFNNNLRTNLYLFVSSVKLARQLGISKKNISVFIPDGGRDLAEFDDKIKKYSEIGTEILRVRLQNPKRFQIRISNGGDVEFSANPIQHNFNGFTCPEQTGKVPTCSECGLCWTTNKNVNFITH